MSMHIIVSVWSTQSKNYDRNLFYENIKESKLNKSSYLSKMPKRILLKKKSLGFIDHSMQI